jgi:hypothetical protein
MPENSSKILDAPSVTRKACSSAINADPLVKIAPEALFLVDVYPFEYQNNLIAFNSYWLKNSSLRIFHSFYKLSRMKVTIYYNKPLKKIKFFTLATLSRLFLIDM